MRLGSLISGEGGSYCRDLLEATKFFTLESLLSEVYSTS